MSELVLAGEPRPSITQWFRRLIGRGPSHRAASTPRPQEPRRPETYDESVRMHALIGRSADIRRKIVSGGRFPNSTDWFEEQLTRPRRERED